MASGMTWEAPAVMPVRCKTGTAMPRIGSIAHQVARATAVFRDGKARYAARWWCGAPPSSDVILLADPEQHGIRVCRNCLDAVDGPTVYRCYSAEGDLLYIGCTEARRRRMGQHAAGTPWWLQVTCVSFEDFPDIDAALIAERRAIVSEHPQRNRQYARETA